MSSQQILKNCNIFLDACTALTTKKHKLYNWRLFLKMLSKIKITSSLWGLKIIKLYYSLPTLQQKHSTIIIKRIENFPPMTGVVQCNVAHSPVPSIRRLHSFCKVDKKHWVSSKLFERQTCLITRPVVWFSLPFHLLFTFFTVKHCESLKEIPLAVSVYRSGPVLTWELFRTKLN